MRLNVVLNWQINVVGLPDSPDDYESDEAYEDAQEKAIGAIVAYLREQDLVEATSVETPDSDDNEVTATIDLNGNPVEED